MIWNGTIGPTATWEVLPSPIGGDSACRVSRTVLGERPEPEGIFTSFEFFGPDSRIYNDDSFLLEYDRPYQYNRNYQAESLFLRLSNIFFPESILAIWQFDISACGLDFEIDFELGD
jgi:hypothetical protein